MTQEENCEAGFCGIGTWAGTAEVYDGAGAFLGNGSDQRFARNVEQDGRVRIDLAFIGPLKFAGHYFIKPEGSHRTYQGPANTGFAEAVGDDAVDGNGYWPVTGLSHRLFLAMLPNSATQLHLSMMFRGEQLIYTIVSESQRVPEDGQARVPGLVSGTSFDLGSDPRAGRPELLLHRPGTWSGTLQTFDANLNTVEPREYQETIGLDGEQVQADILGSLAGSDHQQLRLRTNGWQAWSEMGRVVGSYNLSGGRALAGTFHHLDSGLRVWRREVSTNDGQSKAVLHTWYRGGQRVGAQQGVIHFTPTA